jgi:hypothetical protein
VHAQEKLHFATDLKSGLSFVWRIRGLRCLILITAVINFLATMAIMLFPPFFQRDPDLGPVRYGIAMALFTGGMLLGMALTAIVKIPPSRRFVLFQVCGISSMACLSVFPFVGSFPVAMTLLAAAGLANAILNAFIMSVMQLAVPQDMRGKVFSMRSSSPRGSSSAHVSRPRCSSASPSCLSAPSSGSIDTTRKRTRFPAYAEITCGLTIVAALIGVSSSAFPHQRLMLTEGAAGATLIERPELRPRRTGSRNAEGARVA